MKRYGVLFLVISMVVVTSVAVARVVVSDEETFYEAIAEACEGKSVGAQCTVEFIGGSVSIGICVEVPDSPVGGELSCQLNIPELSNCKNNAMGTPSSWLTLGSLAGLLLFLRRKKN